VKQGEVHHPACSNANPNQNTNPNLNPNPNPNRTAQIPELRYYLKSNTTGNKYKLLNHTFHYDTRKYSFSARIVNI